MINLRPQAQPNLPIWHIVAGSSGLLVPILYLLFDEINPTLSRRFPGVSEVLDNIVVFVLPVYITFEVAWLITGSVWVFGTDDVGDPDLCDHTVYVFSVVVVINFWIHLLTPLIFMLGLCCTRLFPYCAYCGYWNILKTGIDNWTRRTRMTICVCIALPLGLSMVLTGGISYHACTDFNDTTSINTNHEDVIVSDFGLGITAADKQIPIWLSVSGCAVLIVPLVYFVYDKYCKAQDGGPMFKNVAKYLVILYLLCGLCWSVIGFLWVFGAHQDEICGAESFTYKFAFSTLLIMNIVMDIWICFKICVVLYWAFLSDD